MTKILIIAIILLIQVNSLHFYLQEGQEKCFMDDIPSNQLIQGYWHFIDAIPGAPKESTTDGVYVYVLGPDGKEVKRLLTTKMKFDSKGETKGKFSLATQKGGQYKFCMKTTSSHWVTENKKIRYGLRIVIGEQEAVTDAAKEQDISNLQEKIHQVMNKAKEFSKFQEMSRQDEDDLSTENLKINERVVLITIIQAVVILVSGIYQIISLKKFFIAKKLY